MKIRVGIVFGGMSREREISFAGGRTVYDNLDKDLFEPVPVFVDSFGNFILLNWEFIYKGSIRDFYPPVDVVPHSPGDFQVYAESLEPSPAEIEKMIAALGKHIQPRELKTLFDFAFLCLHGPFGEDGRIQGFFEYLGIPYSGSGILPSAIGIDKIVQKKLMSDAGFSTPAFFSVSRGEWFGGQQEAVFKKAEKTVGFPLVVKSATQGSSIGISILQNASFGGFRDAVNKSFFTAEITVEEWNGRDADAKNNFIRVLTDIREGIGLPVVMNANGKQETIFHPDALAEKISKHFASASSPVFLEALDAESEILIEGFIEGKEFSCIVVENETGEGREPVALPPTEIRKGKELFDYRSKYLPGLSRKITPIELPDAQIDAIRRECERLFRTLGFDVYARIDGFISKDGKIFLNDPNTTSGMMPSSFFFHQAAEIGLNPSQFLTYIIRTSLRARIRADKNGKRYDRFLAALDEAMHASRSRVEKKTRVAVILGGYSSERHISVESGRNVYEKLASSSKYTPVPVFLSGNAESFRLFVIPVNILLKDNADDIREKIEHWKVHPVIRAVISECGSITGMYSDANALAAPRGITFKELAQEADAVFIALHGRPGEDGAVQQQLDAVGLPYNGSGSDSSAITIDKYRTNEILKENGFLVAEHMLVSEEEWNRNKAEILSRIEEKIHWPFIAKPVDDGCSSAVRKIKTKEELEAFAKLIFRKAEDLDAASASLLKIKPKEEFPLKRVFLVEELISKKEAKHFLEVTGGMLTRYNAKGEVEYEVFEASEALSEGEVLSLEEKFLAGQGQNITPARYSADPAERQQISAKVKATLGAAARLLNIQGYTRIDAFVRIYNPEKVEVIFVEVNSLPGMTPATCIFHQAAISHYKPYDFIDKILDFGFARRDRKISQPA
ncbi:MAG TPA: D-alanine--D-alanine ligase [Bacteroidia bacterium]|nr:D-alanine--D-alanine ligase [Bacteroidia bacterium]